MSDDLSDGLFDEDGEPAWLPAPYADGTSGQQGHASADAEPERRKNILLVLPLVRDSGSRGITVAEVRRLTGWHHGQASGALSGLHLLGRVTRLTERRGTTATGTTPARTRW